MGEGEGMGSSYWTERPELTFSRPVSEYLRAAYGAATVILEYGTGGSTVLASEQRGKTIYAVESDKVWTQNLRRFVEQSDQTRSVPRILHVDIGPTKEWGHPINESSWKNFHKYPISVWSELIQEHPDLVLIDGRFRAACFLTCCLMTTRPLKILFDDYRDRKNYHLVEQIAKPLDFVDQMAIFEIEPGLLDRKHFPLFLSSMCSAA